MGAGHEHYGSCGLSIRPLVVVEEIKWVQDTKYFSNMKKRTGCGDNHSVNNYNSCSDNHSANNYNSCSNHRVESSENAPVAMLADTSDYGSCNGQKDTVPAAKR